ncbi:YceI family protein [Roseovarius sp. SCSIO 43702]|uniref:YceI family protein n=1 Tax=Roseovarius sp. SCSIO 43702 TaxID=2823043 RepID=UPI001C7381B9|nr:YceI family protein [Roseovarius sp. SCSIO 43702]QYX56036.1 YceI family protein [Roseovarius sp. SCSIO 43702]
MKSIVFATAATLVLGAGAALAAPEKYMLDPAHSQVMFTYDHLGFSKTYNAFSGFEGEIMFDAEDPASSSVSVSIPTNKLYTGWEERFQHMMSEDFLGTAEGDMVSFTSTGIEVTGDDTAKIMGDLTINGETKPVTLDAKLNKVAEHPMNGKETLGFEATTTIKRSDFGAGKFAPNVGDELDVTISIEAQKAE